MGSPITLIKCKIYFTHVKIFWHNLVKNFVFKGQILDWRINITVLIQVEGTVFAYKAEMINLKSFRSPRDMIRSANSKLEWIIRFIVINGITPTAESDLRNLSWSGISPFFSITDPERVNLVFSLFHSVLRVISGELNMRRFMAYQDITSILMIEVSVFSFKFSAQSSIITSWSLFPMIW